MNFNEDGFCNNHIVDFVLSIRMERQNSGENFCRLLGLFTKLVPGIFQLLRVCIETKSFELDKLLFQLLK